MVLNIRKGMTNRVNSIMMALLMVLGVFASSIGNESSNEHKELIGNEKTSYFSSNNSSGNEWVIASHSGSNGSSSNYSSNDIIVLGWYAGNLVSNVTYNVSANLHGYTGNYSTDGWNATPSQSNYTVFNTSGTTFTSMFQIAAGALPLSPDNCYFAQFELYDEATRIANNTLDGGHIFSPSKLDLGCITNNSGGSGNNNGGNNNTGPIFAPDYHISLQEDHQVTFVLNATHSQNQALTYTAQSQPNNGTLSFQSNGTATYTPDANYWGMDYFSYAASDGTNYSSAMVWLNVSCVVDVPAIPGDCGNNSGGNNTGPMESLYAWTDYSNYNSSDDIDLKWNATDLVWNMSINYNVAVDVYGYNSSTNNTSIVWADNSTFSPTTDWFHDGFTIYAGTLSTGCYYASFDLSDDDDGMIFAYTGFHFGVGMDCSNSGGNNNNNPEWVSVTFHESQNLSSSGGLHSYHHYIAAEDVDINMSMYGLWEGGDYNMSYSLSHMNSSTGAWSDVYQSPDQFFYGMDDSMGGPVSFFIVHDNVLDQGQNTFGHEFYDGCWNLDVELFNATHQLVAAHWGEMFTVGNNNSCSPSGGNNSGGNNTNQISYSSTLDQYCWNSTDIIEISIEMHGLNMSQIVLEWEITDFETGQIYASMDNEPTIGGLLNVSTTGSVYYTWQFEAGSAWLPVEPGKYEIMINPADTSLDNLFTDSPYFYTIEIGCNTGPSDCGINASWTELMVWTDNSVYYQGNTVDATIVSNCTVIGETYILEYELLDSQMNIVASNVANPYWWDAVDIYSVENLSWGGNLTADNYCLNVDLLDLAMDVIDSQTHCFTVNAPATSWDNNTVRLIYIKPLSQSADQHTPLSMHFVANPMAVNSPFDASLICSKDDGYSADVWEAYVPLPFNNITSWKVKNTYGIVMGMFVIYDAEFLGASSMQSPTIIFEQNLTYNGHSPATLVDTLNFECPMVTVSSSITPVMVPSGDVISYAVDISVNNSGVWVGDLNWEVITVSNNASFALADIGGHLLIEHTGALLDSQFSPDGVIADYICVTWELVDENEDILSEGENCIEFIPLSEPECIQFTISNVADEYLEGDPVSIWFNTNLECHGYTIQYWINSTLIGEATSGSIDIDANDASSWMSSGANEISNAIMWTQTDIDQPEMCIEANLISSTNQSAIIDSESICFSVVLPSEPTWEELCEEWEYWNQDMIDTALPGNGCPHYIDESADEGEDSGTGLPAISSLATLSAAVLAVFVIATRREEQ